MGVRVRGRGEGLFITVVRGKKTKKTNRKEKKNKIIQASQNKQK